MPFELDRRWHANCAGRSRTCNHLLNRQPLCQLSYGARMSKRNWDGRDRTCAERFRFSRAADYTTSHRSERSFVVDPESIRRQPSPCHGELMVIVPAPDTSPCALVRAILRVRDRRQCHSSAVRLFFATFCHFRRMVCHCCSDRGPTETLALFWLQRPGRRVPTIAV